MNRVKVKNQLVKGLTINKPFTGVPQAGIIDDEIQRFGYPKALRQINFSGQKRSIINDFPTCHLQHPIPANSSSACHIVRCGNIGSRQLSQRGNEFLPLSSGADIAAIQQQIAIIGQRPPNRGKLICVGCQRSVVEYRIADGDGSG